MRRAGLIAAVALGVVAIAGGAAWLVAFRHSSSSRTAGPVTLRTHAEHSVAVYPMTWREAT